MREVTKETFQEIVGQGTVLIDVWGPACAPCIAMMPRVEGWSRMVKGVEVVKLDSSKNRRLCMEHRIMGLPAFLLFHNGNEVGRIGGNDVTFERMTKWVDDHLHNLHQLPPTSTNLS